MKIRYDIFPTPCGQFSVAVDDQGAVLATAFGGRAALQTRLHSCRLINGPGRRSLRHSAEPGCQLSNDHAALRSARDQVVAYFAGVRRDFDLPLAAVGTGFQRKAWAALRRIPFGEMRSYGWLAADLGCQNSARAVGRANATNPICLIVPCHRVIGANGSLTGYAFGQEIKRRLLEFERLVLAQSAAA